MVKLASRFVLAFGFAALALGCGGGGGGGKDTSVPVKGSVKIAGGKALSGGQITFQAAGGKPVSSVIMADGNYEISLPPGDYKVAVDNSNLKGVVNPSMAGGGAAMPGMEGATQKYVPINAKYGNVENSGLSTKVEGKAHTYDIELK
jgi:hypothetical protein